MAEPRSHSQESALNHREFHNCTHAARLLGSLPVVLSDDDLGIAEAMRRDAEMEFDPSAGITLEQLKASLDR
jgi:hypothetical protein